MSVNKVILLGRVGNDPEVKFMPSGNAVVNLSIATNRKFKNQDSGSYEDKTEWHKIVIFSPGLADVVEKYLKKGSLIYSDLISIRLKLKRLILNQRLLGYIFNQIIKDRKELKALFIDVHSKKNFNKFLDIMLNFKNRYIIGSEYSFVPFENLGYMTYIFFSQNMLRKNYNIMYDSDYKLHEILKHNNSKLYTNVFFKTENLNYSLKKFLIKNKIKLKNFNKLKNNSTSKILNKNLKSFFYNKNILLIEKKEDYIFKKFNYKKLSIDK